MTIFEGKEKIGGILRYGIPEFRLPKSVLDDFEYRHLILKDIKVRPNTMIGADISIDDLMRDGYKAIFVGTGVWKPNALHIKGETLGHVHFGINYLNSPDSYHLGERVIVIGAGNAAMDVARTAIRHGVRYLQCFSRSEGVAASKHEFDYAVLEGVEFFYCKAPVEITDEGVIFADVIEHEDGSVEQIPDTEKQAAIQSMIRMTEISEKENAAETLLRAKGFVDPVVSITEDQVDVVVNAVTLTDPERAQIEDIVKRKTEVGANGIVITLMDLAE